MMSWTKAASRLPERKRSGQGRPGQGRQIEHMLYQFRSSGSRLQPPKARHANPIVSKSTSTTEKASIKSSPHSQTSISYCTRLLLYTTPVKVLLQRQLDAARRTKSSLTTTFLASAVSAQLCSTFQVAQRRSCTLVLCRA